MSNTPRETTLNPSDFTRDADHLTISHDESGLVIVTLAYPERRNAMSQPMTAAWSRAMTQIAADPAIRAVVITGEGKAFCAGGALDWIGGDGTASVAELRTRMLDFYRTWLAVRQVPVPVIAALNGPAVGAGGCVALAADIRIASEYASFSVPFLKLGIHPGMATTYLLPEVTNAAVARDLLFTGRTVGAHEMLSLGIVSQVVEPDELLNHAIEVGHQVCATAPIATRLTKAALQQVPMTFDRAIQWEGLAQPITLDTEDVKEGLAAAMERRSPHFTGR